MSIDALEKALADAQKQLAAKEKKERKEREAKENLSDCERIIREENAQCGPHIDDMAVQQFLLHCKMEPREILEARHLAMIGKPAPKEARRIWLVERLAYDFQIKHRMETRGECPESILRNAKDQRLTYHGAKPGVAYDADEPRDSEIWDDTFVCAAQPNPYSKGDARTAFFCVEMGGKDGVAFAPLCKTLEEMLECAVDRAQDVALDMFTKNVRAGLTKVLVR